ncbi:MAG TPA: invasin domain 3-containing protein [Gemmatimonadales bacterium]|nr:invasin domain 3-containing protein [Gemmatimonadales bacterium]
MPVDSFYVSWSSSNAGLATINGLGVLQAPNARGVVFVRGVTPNGVKDSTRVTFVPVPVAVAVVSGSGQTGVVAARLPLPLRVRVTAADNLGVKGVPVRFQALTGGGSVRDSVVITDSLGFAEDSVSLGTVTGAATFQASVTGLTPAPFTATATAGAISAAQSVVSVSAPTLASGAAATLTLQAKDAFGNTLTSGGAIVVFTSSGGTSTGAIGSTTDNGNGTYTAAFTGVVAGSATTIGATVNGTAVTTTLPTLTVTAGGISAAGSVVSVSSATVTSGGSITLTLQAKDAAGNTITTGGATVVFSRSGGTSTGTIGATTDHADGTYTATFTGTVAGTATTIGATINGAAVTTALPTVTVTAGAISAATSLVTTSSGTVAAGAGATLTLQAKDAIGNNLTTGGATVVFTAAGGTSVGTIGATTDHGDGTYSATFTGVTAGTATTLRATVNGVATTSSTAITVVPGNAVTAQSIIAVSADTVIAGGTVTLTLQAKDSLGNNLTAGGLVVVFTRSGGTSVGTIGPTTDHNNGTYTAIFTATVAGTATTIGATIGGAPVTSTLPSVTVIPGAISTATSLVTVSAATVASGAAVTLTLQAKDAAGNNLTKGGAVVAFTASGGTSTGVVSATTDHNDGTYTATFTGVLAGTATTIRATIGGTAVTSTLPTVTVTPGGISIATSVVTASDSVVQVGATDTLFLRAKDAAGNLLTTGGALVAFTQSAGAGVSAGTISSTTDLGTGLYRAIFTGSVSGTPTTIGATISGVPVSSTPLPTIRVSVTTHTVDITADSTWTTAASPHIVNGYLRIRNGATLTIQPGALVKFNAGSGLQVGDTAANQAGGLVLDGTAAPIVLTANTATPAAGFWRGIEVQRSLPVAPWRKVTIEYGGGARAPFGAVAAEACVLFVNRSGAQVDLDSVRIRQCIHAGIHHFGGVSHVHRSQIDTVSGSGVHVDFDAQLELDSTTVRFAGQEGLFFGSPASRLLPSSGNQLRNNAVTGIHLRAVQLPGLLRQDSIVGNATNFIVVDAGPVDPSVAAFTIFAQPQPVGLNGYLIQNGLLDIGRVGGQALTLDSNVVLRFTGQTGLVIGDSAGSRSGTLRSLGTNPANRAVLMAASGTLPGAWIGVEIGRLSGPDTLRFVRIVNAGDSLAGRTAHHVGLWVRNPAAALFVLDGANITGSGAAGAPKNSAGLAVTGTGGVELRNSNLFQNVGYGIALDKQGFKVVDDTIDGHTIGIAAFMNGGSQLTAADSISGNLFRNNQYAMSLTAASLRALRTNAITTPVTDTLLFEGGLLTADATLPHVPGFVWRATQTTTVDSGATFTVAPGDTVAFDTTAGILVGGSAPAALAADGTAGTILFTASGPLPFGWGGIDFHLMSGAGATTNNVLRHVDVDRAGFSRPCFGDCNPFQFGALRFTDSLTPTSVNVSIDHIIVRRSNSYALDFQRGGTGTVGIQSSQFYQNPPSPMIRARSGHGSQLTIGTSDLYHYRAQAIEGIYKSASPADSVSATNNWWGDVAGVDTGFSFQDSLGRATTVFGAVRTVPFAAGPFFPVGPAAGVVTTRDSLLNPASLGDSIGIYARVVDANGRGVPGTVSWTPLPAGASTIAPSSSPSDLGGRVNAGWKFTNTAGRLTAHATGGGGFTDYFIDVQPGVSTAVNWALDAARSQGVVTGPRAITFTSTNRAGVVVTHSHDGFNNATQPFNICFTDLNASGCTFPFPPYGFVDSTHTSGGVNGDTIFFHANVTQPTPFVLRATYTTASGQVEDSVVVTMASIPAGIRIDRDPFSAGVQVVPDTLVLNGLCPGGQPNFYCQRDLAAVVVDSGLSPVPNQDAAFRWTLVPATGAPVTFAPHGALSDSALVTAVANGFARLIATDTTTNDFGADTLPILVQQKVSQLLVSPDTVSVLVGGTATFAAVAIDVAGDTVTTAQIHWRPYTPFNPHITITDTATANQATVRLDSTPVGQEYVTAFTVIAPGDTAYGFGQVINPVLKQMPVGLEPWAIAANTQSHTVYVGHQFGPIYKIDGSTDAVVDSVAPGLTVGALAVNSATNRLFAATNQGVVVLDGTTLSTVTTVATGTNSQGVTNLQGLTVDSVGNRIWVTVAPPGAAPQHLLRQIDGATNTFSAGNDVSLPDTGAGAAFNPANGRLYVAIPDSNLVVVVDPGTHAITQRISVGSTPTFVAVNPVTNRVYVINQSSSDLSVIDAGAGTVIATVPLFYFLGGLAVDVVHNRVYVGVVNLPYLLVVNGGTNVFENTLISGDPAFSEAIRGVAVDGQAGNGKIFTSNYGTGTVARLKF